MRSVILDTDYSVQRAPWQPQFKERLVGIANGKTPNEALLQFQKGSPRSINPTRIYRYQCSAIEMSGGYGRKVMERL